MSNAWLRGTVKAIAVIEWPAVIRKILAHLALPTVAPSPRSPLEHNDDFVAVNLGTEPTNRS